MLQYIKDLPSHVVGIHAIGEVTDEDYEKIALPKIAELNERTGELYYLLILETKVSDFTFGAWLKDAKLGFKYFKNWKKIAIVTDQKGVQWFSDIFRFFIPGKSKGYSLDKLDEAIKWISEKKE